MKRIAIGVILLGLVGGAQPCRAAVTVGAWQPIYCGIAYATGSDGTKVVKAMRIDLQAPGIEFYATPHTGTQDTRTTPTSKFLTDNGLQVAINGNLYTKTSDYTTYDTDVSGLQVSRGTVVSPASVSEQRCVLRITAGNVASFDYVNSTPYDTAGIYNAVSGYGFYLTDGVPSTDTSSSANRTVAGLSADGRFLVLATISSATHKECGEWLQRFGCFNGLNLDGGGSSTLVRSDGSGGATILYKGGAFERYVGSHLGVFALNQPGPLTVSFNAQGGAVSPASVTVTNGMPYGPLPAPTRTAYTFSGWWTGGGLAVTAATVVAASSNHTLVATWIGNPCTVTFDPQGGAVSPASATVTNGLAYGALPTPARADYTFGGWWTGADGTGTQVTSATIVTVTENHALFAKWNAISIVPAFEVSTSTGRAPFSVTFDDQSTGTITNRHWDFGDGTWTNTLSTNLVHLYTNAGSYTVRLVVSGPLGAATNTWAYPVVVYGDFANAIPYQATFEPPGMKAGDSIVVPWNSNGWYGGPESAVAVTNLAYGWPAAGYPVASATHSNVLGYRDAFLTNRFAQAPGQPQVVVDFMNQLGRRVIRVPDANTLADAKTALLADTNGYLNVWCSGDQNHTNRTWVVYTNVLVGKTDWARLTVGFDYSSDKANGLTFFSVALNGVMLPVPGGLGYAYDGEGFTQRTGGTWLVSANPAVKQVTSVTFDGSGRLDDFVVTTNAPEFLSFPGSGERSPPGTLMIIR